MSRECYIYTSNKGDILPSKSSPNFNQERREFLDRKYKEVLKDLIVRNNTVKAETNTIISPLYSSCTSVCTLEHMDGGAIYYDALVDVIALFKVPPDDFQEANFRSYVVEFIGGSAPQEVDLSNYYTKPEIDELLRALRDKIDGIKIPAPTIGTNKFRIKHVNSLEYLLGDDDLAGNVMLLCDFEQASQTLPIAITLGRPSSEDFIGSSVIIRNCVNPAEGGERNLLPVGCVTILQKHNDDTSDYETSLFPQDASTLRRFGSTVTVVYVGNGRYELFGELN